MHHLIPSSLAVIGSILMMMNRVVVYGENDSLRGAIAEKLQAGISSSSTTYQMYIAGTAPWCNGYCNDGDTTIRHKIERPWGTLYSDNQKPWSGYPSEFGNVCGFAGTKALCLRTGYSGQSYNNDVWDVPMCTPSSACTDSDGCNGCPAGWTNEGDWAGDDAISCCAQMSASAKGTCADGQSSKAVRCRLVT
jgi:hypothetical protein